MNVRTTHVCVCVRLEDEAIVNDLLLHFDYLNRYEVNKLHFGITEYGGGLLEKLQIPMGRRRDVAL